ncbi:AarF/UbiB family protein [Desulfosporosinus sp. PR]|uniref:ABC1 kinase family protein n=1 Tax=Candidatus Desulfosporosinus nitrosoreducens TaxID=3401928 RepID=UPI0027F1A603|nr:AarF/UbiB family protein [Desulfosporosinus sp. PR]MDQ7094495.1 AarF/UbiB family protein [Desulfosporosinus sp. PR]
MLATIFRHFSRYQEILSVLMRHGFGFILLENMGSGNRRITEAGMASLGQGIRRVLADLGPTFIKIGQFASTRPDLIPGPIIKELEKLQDRVPQLPFELIRRTIEQELGAPLQSLFSDFNPSPLAAASIGQVHYARLKSGEPVAVKVQRPNIAGIIRTDLEIIAEIIPLLERRFPKVQNYFLSGILREFSRWLENEQDYLREGKNAETVAQGFVKDQRVVFPSIYWSHTTRRVLTMSYLEGVKLNEREKVLALYDGKRIAELLSHSLLLQIVRDGVFHGDPHPGNILVLPGERIGYVDFGIVGTLTPALKGALFDLIMALNRRDTRAMAKALLQLGLTARNSELESLCQDLAEMQRKHLDVPIAQIALHNLVDDCMNLAFRHDIEFPPEFVLLGKSLLTLEGIVHELDPGMSLAELVKPFRKRLIVEHFALRSWLKKVFTLKKVLKP